MKNLKFTWMLVAICLCILAIVLLMYKITIKTETKIEQPVLVSASMDMKNVMEFLINSCNESGCSSISTSWSVTESGINIIIQEPTTGSVSVTFEAQPEKLPGNYQDNGTFLRAWAEKNKTGLLVPAEAKNIKIGFVFAKVSTYRAIPGNLQLSVDGKNLCNGRLIQDGVKIFGDEKTIRYNFTNIPTQDKPKGVDLSSAVWKVLGIKARIGEHGNFLKSVTLTYDL